jgi:F0F1-type ATP synthase membrane subunit b/b'
MKKILMLLLVVMGFGAYAQKPAVVADNEAGWTHIGQVTASFKTTSESIIVLGADEFQAIKLKVNEAPIHIERVQVFYESGQMEELDVQSELRENAETRVINLSNPTRDIKKVQFTYRTLPNATSDKADVALYGLKTSAQGDAYIKDDVNEAKREAREESRELREDAREVKREANEEAREMKREANEEANEAEREADRVGNEVERDAERTGDEIESEAREGESEVKGAARKTGDAVSEAAAKAAAAITDKKHDSKVGPDGQTVYIDDDTKYYYINEEGKKVYVTKMQLKDKPDND